MQNVAELIKQSVSVRDAVEMYLPGTKIRHNRIPCPIHNGSDNNLSFRDDYFKCFVCGVGGDVITFVRHIFKCDFFSATEKLNRDFNLGLPIGRKASLSERRSIAKKCEELYAARREKERLEKRERELWDRWIDYDRTIRELRPKCIGEEFDERYIEACKNISYIEYLIDSGGYYE